MANILRIGIKTEKDIVVKDNKLVENKIQPIGYQVYANVDSISCWIGSCTDMESLEEIISEEELITSIEESASEDELSILMAALECSGMKYNFFDTIKTARKIR